MVDASQVECLGTTLVRLVAKILGAHAGDRSLLIIRAGSGGHGLHAGISTSGSETGAAVQCSLWCICCAAIKAALLAPAEEARSLAILGCILTVGGIALGAP